MIKILELFGGIGAPRKALINLSIDHKSIDYVEIKENRVRAYNALYERLHKPQSVVGWNLKPDILIHGSPCQDNSRAQYSSNTDKVNKRRGAIQGSGTRSSLMFETIKIIRNMGEWKPKVVLWENVTGVLDKGMIGAFNQYLKELTDLGYRNSFEVLNAADFGIPQQRERVFCVSKLNGLAFDFSQLTKIPTKHISNFLEKDVTDPKYMITIPSMMNRIEELNPIKPDDKYKRRLNVIKDHCWTITERQDRCPNAGVIRLDGPQYRYLTEREVWRLMGFNDYDFNEILKKFPTKEGKRNATLYQLAGNSIVVPVLEAIFEVLINEDFETEFITASNGQLQLV